MDAAFNGVAGYNSATVNPTQNGKIDPIQARWMQVYITWACGFPLQADGKIGIKTLNAARFCTSQYANWKPGFYFYLKQRQKD